MDGRRTQAGFTIIELLVAVVIIGILASVTIVAFNGAQGRAMNSKMRQDMATIKKALKLYKADEGRYPNSENCDNQAGNYAYGWCGWNQGTGNSFIPGLSPKYLSAIPNLDAALASNDTYLYKGSDSTSGSNDGGGRYYSLIRYRAAGLPAHETQGNPDLWMGSGYDGIAWGFKSDPSLPHW